ncbi:hypothetical protein [Desulfallas thermosapovorans]|uniref:Uncharacterized protein n=1 Tax=Desulfallas thermosapovorans DSM 6562 TaxID=1121431 RepID=A0A5S4ZPY8_9FIRM|nr:hypothetical protein [Desulfallas thermosapovorans]TYO94962.1 hypothetical protein LX24_01978 [Desulfallas thermosapovorans DSM 6562]
MKRTHLWGILLISILTIAVCILWPPGSSKNQIIQPVYGLGLPQPNNIEYTKEPGHIYLITVDRLVLQDLVDNPDLFNEITGQAALGLMSVGVEGGLIPDNTYASIGAGAPINASGTALHGLNAWELLQGIPASEIYQQRTGLNAPAGTVLQLDIARIKTLNAESRYSAIPGLLGTVLQDNGIAVSVLGNADSSEKSARPAVALAMNKNGLIKGGDVSDNLLVDDPSFPGGLRTDYDKLLSILLESYKKPGLTVVELGDLERLEKSGAYLEESVLKSQRRETLNKIASFITHILEQMDEEHDMLLIISPTPRGNYVPGTNYLTPVLAVHNSIQPGLLTSPTTRRPGIIKNTDLAPTILDYFNIEAPANMYGRPLHTIDTDLTIATLSTTYEQLEQTYQYRSPVLKNYVLVLLILVLLSLAAVLLPRANELMKVLKPLLLAVMAVPITLLLITLLPHKTPELLILEIIVLTIGITAAIYLWLANHNHDLDPFIIISLTTSLCIVVDLFLGAPLQKNSLLGYDPIAGARFYGLGNEYMGVLLGSTIIGTAAFIDRLSTRHRKTIIVITGLYYLVTLYAIAAPDKGTNVGGSIAGVFAFLVTFLLLLGFKFDLKIIAKTAATVSVFLLALIFYDLQRPTEGQSHIGRTANLIIYNGPGEILNIIYRKASMNIKLIKYTIWSRVFLASLVSLAILFYRPVGIMKQIFTRYTNLYTGFIGVTIASIMALIFNDSGIVAAATAMIFCAPPLLYLVIRTLRPNV